MGLAFFFKFVCQFDLYRVSNESRVHDNQVKAAKKYKKRKNTEILSNAKTIRTKDKRISVQE